MRKFSKLFLNATIIGILISAVPAWAIDPQSVPQAQIFLLQNGSKNIECTATLFRADQNTCAMVTNAHCIGARVSQVNVSEMHHRLYSVDLYRPEVRYNDAIINTFKVGVLKISKEMDLAQLSIPPELQNFYCDGLSVSSDTDPQQVAADEGGLLSVGFVNQTPFSTMSGRSRVGVNERGQTVTWPFVGVSQRSLYATGIPEMPNVIKVMDFKIRHGMSGGAVVDQNKHLVGINVWLREQGIDESFFIPTYFVNQFLNTTHQQILDEDSTNSSSRKFNPAGGNGHSDGGGNGHSDGGGNGHSDGGGNGHSDGGNSRSSNQINRWGGVSLERVQKLSEFFFPPEGVINPRNKNQIILGIDGQSVDGFDDYQRLKNQFEAGGPVVMKDNQLNSMSDAVTRLTIFERLAGTYTSMQADKLGLPQSTGRSSFFVRAAGSGFYEKNNSKSGMPKVELSIDPISKSIRLLIAEHVVNDKNDPDENDSLPRVADIFKFEMKDEGRQIYLAAQSQLKQPLPYICQNDQYMKLNCLSKAASLSLHLVKSGQLEIVVSFLSPSEKGILHIHAQLSPLQ